MYESNLRVAQKDGQHQSRGPNVEGPADIPFRELDTYPAAHYRGLAYFAGGVTSKNTLVTASLPKYCGNSTCQGRTPLNALRQSPVGIGADIHAAGLSSK